MPWTVVNVLERDLVDFTGLSNGALGSKFSLRNGGTNPQVVSGAMASNASGFFPCDFSEFICAGPDQYAAVNIGTVNTSGNVTQFIHLRSNNSSSTGVTLAWLAMTPNGAGTSGMAIYTATTWAFGSGTSRASISNATYTAGDFIEFYVINNTYYAVQNGTAKISWNDSGAAVNATGRTVGFGPQNNNIMTFSRVIAGDMRYTPQFYPSQALMRSATR